MKKIKLILLVVAAILAATTISFAQAYTISPNDTIIVNSVFGNDEQLNIYQINNTTGTIQIKYQKVMAFVPPLWDAVICDNQNCYPLLVNSGSMNVLQGKSGLLSVHCTPYTNEGTAFIRYAVWDVNTPNNIDTLTFIISVLTTGIASESKENTSIWITQNKLHLNNKNGIYNSLYIMDLSGKVVFNTNIGNESEIDIPYLPTAMYIISLNSKQKQFVKKVFYRN